MAQAVTKTIELTAGISYFTPAQSDRPRLPRFMQILAYNRILPDALELRLETTERFCADTKADS